MSKRTKMKMEPLKVLSSGRKSLIDIAEEKALSDMEQLRLKQEKELLELEHKLISDLDEKSNSLQEIIVSAFKERARKYNEKTKVSEKTKVKKPMSMRKFTYYLYLDFMILAFLVAFFFVYCMAAPFAIVGGLFVGIMSGILFPVMLDLISFIYKKTSKKIRKKSKIRI